MPPLLDSTLQIAPRFLAIARSACLRMFLGVKEPKKPIRPKSADEMRLVREAKNQKRELIASVMGDLRATARRRSFLKATKQDISGIDAPSVCVSSIIAKAQHQPWLHDLDLRELLVVAGMDRPTADRLLGKIRHRLAVAKHDTSSLTVGWLLDRRTRGARLAAWVDVHSDVDPPSVHWPFGADLLEGRPPAPAAGAAATTAGHRSYDLPQPSARPFAAVHADLIAEVPVPVSQMCQEDDAASLFAPERMDPYYVQFLAGFDLPALTHSQRRARAHVGAGSPPPPRRPHRLLLGERLMAEAPLLVSVAGALISFGALTEDQISALIAPTVARARLRRFLDLGYEAEVFARTQPSGDASRLPRIYTMRSKGTWDYLAAHFLSYTDVLAATGGRDWLPSVARTRHEVLTAELLLRWAAAGSADAILGERFAERRSLAYGVIASDHQTWTKGRGDGVVVRPDGLPVVIETTANLSAAFAEKVRAWIDFLWRVPESKGGCSVAFVLAIDPHHSDAKRVLARASRIVDRELEASNRRPFVAHRIGLASWSDWFPDMRHVRDNSFAAMRLLSPSHHARGWVLRAFLDEADYPFTPDEPDVAKAVIDHALLLSQSPRFLNAGRRELLASQGLHLPSDIRRACGWSTLPIPNARHGGRRAIPPEELAQRWARPPALGF